MAQNVALINHIEGLSGEYVRESAAAAVDAERAHMRDLLWIELCRMHALATVLRRTQERSGARPDLKQIAGRSVSGDQPYRHSRLQRLAE
jgi:hypothetical protein